MRKTLVLAVLLALSVPVAGLGAGRADDGTLSVENGRGKVNVTARGGLIGRLDRGSVTFYDLTPNDAHAPVVTGDDQPIVLVGEKGLRYRGQGVRFRVLGGKFRVVIQGRGIDLSVVGRGTGFLEGNGLEPGLYSLDGADCRRAPATCETLPAFGIRFTLGGSDKSSSSSSSK